MSEPEGPDANRFSCTPVDPELLRAALNEGAAALLKARFHPTEYKSILERVQLFSDWTPIPSSGLAFGYTTMAIDSLYGAASPERNHAKARVLALRLLFNRDSMSRWIRRSGVPDLQFVPNSLVRFGATSQVSQDGSFDEQDVLQALAQVVVGGQGDR
jgi:hypothetical protein